MKVVGIIAEYNPFHNGHQYQLDKIKKETGADFCVIAMSGNFLQRGIPALCDKFTRTEMGLKCGADLVLEIPTIWATASAEYYAKAGVFLLASTGVVTHLCFGAETDDLNSLLQISTTLKEETDLYRSTLSQSLRRGNSFPSARKQALLASLPDFSKEKLDDLLDHPNNILALEYLKALPDSIEPILIKREGAGYHDTDINTLFASATAIRKALLDETDSSYENLWQDISKAMPEESFTLLQKAANNKKILQLNDFSESLGYCLLSRRELGFSEYADCNLALSNKIKNHINDYVLFEDFINVLKTKDMTYTRINRCLLHILLDIKQNDYAIHSDADFTPYLRILGFKKEASALLSSMKQNATAHIISKIADASLLLEPRANIFLTKDIFASNLYYQHIARKSGTKPQNEYTNQIITL